MPFDAKQVVPDAVLAKLTELRVGDPDFPLRAAHKRKRPDGLSHDGRLSLLAIDHPARLVTAAGTEPLAMANRQELLARTVSILATGAADGVLASMDLLEELLTLHELSPARFLDGKVLIASLNRGGLAGSAWELDDPWTGPSATACRDLGLDGAKVLLRVALEERDTLRTLEACAKAVSELAKVKLPCFLEPLVVTRQDGGWKMSREPEPLAKLVGVASALGDTSRGLWLKLPATERFELVAKATSLPILLLGGEAAGNLRPVLRELDGALKAGSNVRGTLVGRNVLFPGSADPAVAAKAVHDVVHGRQTLEAAVASLS